VPQPLSKIVHGKIRHFVIAPNAAAQEPELAALVAQAISICSESDYYLGRALIDMLGPRAAPAFAIYEALAWGYSKKQALRAAAAISLDDQDCKLFDAILKLYGQDESQRNKFSHWLWCYSNQASGYIILLDPLQTLRWEVVPHISPGVARTIVPGPVAQLGESSCYSKAELEQIVERFTNTICLIETFRNLVGVPGVPKDQMRDYLMTQPRMIEALRHPGKPIQTPPSTHHEPPG